MNTGSLSKFDVLSLNVRGIRDQIKRRSIFSYLKDQKANIYFSQETYSERADENIWRKEWGGELFFSHGTKHSKGVCILINPFVQPKVDYSYANDSGRIVLITITFNGQKLSLCNIYAPNDQVNQLQFMQELNNCIIDKSELTSLIVGGDWNCTLSKKDKIGGAPWKPSNFRNLILTTMEMFDLVDVQRMRHPKLCKFTYESKSLKLKSRIDFFLIANNLSGDVKNSYDQKQELILFNNKDILVDGKPIFLSEWFKKGILSINDLLNESGNFLTFHEFRDKYSCESNFLQYYQVVSAIPKRLWSPAKCSDTINKSFFTRNDNIFSLNESTQINLYKARSRDFYNLLNVKIHTEDQTGPKCWSEKLSLKKDVWTKIFKSLKNICKETKLKEFQFKLIHRTIVTKKELFRFGIKADDECLYCGDKDSIEHSFIECMFTKLFTQKVLIWFNQVNVCQISPTTEETLFGITASSQDTTIIRKFNYTTLFMCHYIYSSKLNSLAINIQDFISKLLVKYNHEKLS